MHVVEDQTVRHSEPPLVDRHIVAGAHDAREQVRDRVAVLVREEALHR